MTDADIKEARRLVRDAVVDNTFGQDGESLYFVVKVSGIGARPESPMKIAETLAAEWSLTPVEWPVATTPSVMVPDSREYAAALDRYVALERACAVAEEHEGCLHGLAARTRAEAERNRLAQLILTEHLVVKEGKV